jgi:hypothetical protein
MKGFGYLTAVVVVAVAIGIGLVGGLPASQTYRLPPARTYSLNGVAFSVAFPGHLGREGWMGQSVEGDAGTSDAQHLMLVIVASRGSPSPPLQALSRFSSAVTASCSTKLAKYVHLRPAKSGAVCESSTERRSGNLTFTVDAISTEGLPAAEAVVKSFSVLDS